MGRLIIDGNSFFEIDEECLKNKKIAKTCGIEKHLNGREEMQNKKNILIKNIEQKKRGDG